MLNRDVKEYGKNFMFDGNEETCWNSDQVRKPQVAQTYEQLSILFFLFFARDLPNT